MSVPKNILVATDFSPPGETAVQRAFDIASELRAKVLVLHVFTLQDKSEVEAVSEHDVRAAERRKLDALADAHRGSGQLAEVLWRDGDPTSEIVKVARSEKVDMVVVGSSGRKGWARLRFGSVAEGVTREAPCTVLVVRDEKGAEGNDR